MSRFLQGCLMFMLFMTGVFSAKMYDLQQINTSLHRVSVECKKGVKAPVGYNNVNYKNIDCAVLSELHEIKLRITW